MVLDGLIVKLEVINALSHRTILLLYKEYRCFPRGQNDGNMEDGIIGIDVNIYTISEIW